MPARLVFIRHGQPLNHREGEPERMSGWTDFPLSDAGREQAALLAQRLKTEQVLFDALYSSPLQRAADTARAISGQCNRALQFMDSLREIGCGCVDGLPIFEVQRDFHRYWQANLLQNDEHFRWPGGESYREMRDRCIAAVGSLAARHAQQCVGIVTHSGVISQIIGHVHGLNPARWECFRPGNCSITEMEWDGDSGRVLRFNDCAHL
jgi:broad specificity phosphatase PhoE